MVYLLNLRLEDKYYDSMIHFISTFSVETVEDVEYFLRELFEGFKRKGALVLHSSYERIDNDADLKEKHYKNLKLYKAQATNSIKIEQFFIDNPDQTKSLAQNLIEKMNIGEGSSAKCGNNYEIPVNVTDKKTGNPIHSDIFYYTIEHLIPKK